MVVYDIREGATKPFLEAGARLASTPSEISSQCDVTFSSLPGPKEVEEVSLGAEGVLNGIKPGAVYCDLSTSSPTLIRRVEQVFRQKGAHVLDTPVSGGKTGAQTRNLAVMVGGDRAVYERVKPILDSFGDKVFYAGDIGAGCICKLVHNMISHGIRQAIAEGMTLGVKAGVDAESLWESVRRGAVGRASSLHDSMPKTIFRGSFDNASFALALSRKDVGLATDLGREYDVPMPVANLAEQIAVEGMNRGWADKDSTILFTLQEEAAGVQVRAPNVDPQKASRFITTHPD
jgi:3-hydroxyisobutyrate dehydrogenase